ncbi:MAG: hypothetical protein KKD29_06725 [Candidatus Omnitrophica bacterium]|nr:hypothetical protein [Candidatus Omnitrophota bacterium]
MKRLSIMLTILLFVSSPVLCAELKQADKLATSLGVVYVGMPKESLYQVFSDLQQKDYRKDSQDEWITFTDWTTKKSGDLITFHLKDGKVVG